MDYQLIYASSAAGLYSPEVYREIASKAAKFNATVGISGLLLMYNETIIQVLEGPQDAVLSLYAKIEIDPRHKSPIKLSGEFIKQREFSQWSMGYEETVDPNEPDFLFQLRHRDLDQKLPETICARTASLLTSFKKSSGLEKTY